MEDIYNDRSIDFWAAHIWLDSQPIMKRLTVTAVIVIPGLAGAIVVNDYPILTAISLAYLCFFVCWRILYIAIGEKVIDFGDRPNKRIN